MAITTQQNKNSIDIATSSDAFNKSYNAGNHADYSGIYKCSKCGREIAHNKDDNPLRIIAIITVAVLIGNYLSTLKTN